MSESALKVPSQPQIEETDPQHALLRCGARELIAVEDGMRESEAS